MRSATICLCCILSSFCFANDQGLDHITIDLKRNWEPMVWGADPNRPSADVVSIDLSGPAAKFCSYDVKRGTFEYRLHIPISMSEHPVLVMKYRATNLDTAQQDSGLYVDLDPQGRMHFKPVADLSKFVADGKEQELRIDLREQQISGVVSRVMIQLQATEKNTATLEVVDLRFESAPDSQHVDYGDDPEITVRVTNLDDKPVAGAKVTCDAERKEAARSKQTDADGRARITPLGNEANKHMVQIEADGMATMLVGISGKSDEPTDVQLMPGVTYGGFIHDEQGQPIEGATVRIFAPPSAQPDPNVTVKRRAVVRTDAKGQWKSPLMPDDGKPPMFKLAHQDFICDKEYDDTPQPPIEELKAGSGVMVLKK